MQSIPYRLSFPKMFLNGLLQFIILICVTFLFCWGLGVYTIRKSTDALFMISFCYTLLVGEIWVGRILRFFFTSGHLKGPCPATPNDLPELKPRQRAWILFIYENRVVIPWVVAGVLAVFIAFELGLILPARFSPDTVLPFLVRDDLPQMMQPGFFTQ